MRRLALVAVALFAACGDDTKQVTPDGAVDPQIDAAIVVIDAPVVADPTFTSFTIDLIVNQTSSTTEAKPFADFATLPDPDENNAAAYSSLF